MQSLKSWHDLAQFGIEPLTGEACGLMMRILCDVTSNGKQVLEKCLGVRSIDLQPPWNSGATDDPHIGSMMLAPEFFCPIAVFCLLESGCPAAFVLSTGSVVGVSKDDSAETVEQWRTIHQEQIRRHYSYAGTAGDRNVHMMSGRVV